MMLTGLKRSQPTHYSGYGSDGSTSQSRASSHECCSWYHSMISVVLRCWFQFDDKLCHGGLAGLLNRWLFGLVVTTVLLSIGAGAWVHFERHHLTQAAELALAAACILALSVTACVFRSDECRASKPDSESVELGSFSKFQSSSSSAAATSSSSVFIRVGRTWLCFFFLVLVFSSLSFAIMTHERINHPWLKSSDIQSHTITSSSSEADVSTVSAPVILDGHLATVAGTGDLRV